MRSETEANREADRTEPGFIKCEQAVPVTGKVPTIEELDQLEKSLFGDKKSPEEELEWWEIGPDNFMLRTLKQAVSLSTHALEKQIKDVEKDIKKAQKVFFS
jgi:hypothetical protein